MKFDYNKTYKEAEKEKIIPIVFDTRLISNASCEAITGTPGSYNLLTMQKEIVLSTAHVAAKCYYT